MRRFSIIAVVLALALAISIPAVAKDKVLEATVTAMVESTDKNGNQYIRFIVGENRSLEGIDYTVGVPVMAFGDQLDKAQSYSIGDTIKCIVQGREFQGRTSYTILSFM